MSRRVLLTGASGLLGGLLARKLARSGHDVLAAGRRSNPQDLTGIEYLSFDLADPLATTRATVAQPNLDVVIHAAARIRGGSLREFETDNVVATANLLEATSKAQLFIYCSTISVYSDEGPFKEEASTNATGPYGSTKRQAEMLCLQSRTSEQTTIILRLGGLHGHSRREGVVHHFFAHARTGEPIRVDEPDTHVTLTFLDDVASLIEHILSIPKPLSGIYNVATTEAVSLRGLAERIRERTGSSSPIASSIASVRRNRVLDVTRLRNQLRYTPIPLSEHLDRFAMGGV